MKRVEYCTKLLLARRRWGTVRGFYLQEESRKLVGVLRCKERQEIVRGVLKSAAHPTAPEGFFITVFNGMFVWCMMFCVAFIVR